MIYLFTWNNSYLLKQEVLRWKEWFISKHWEENITHISSPVWHTAQSLGSILTARSIFNPTSLVILEWLPQSTGDSFAGLTDIENALIDIVDSVPEETIVLFSNTNPDKRKAFYKKLTKVSKGKDFSATWEAEVYNLLSKRYGMKVEEFTLKRIVALKSGNLEKSIWEIDKLLITRDRLEIEDIKDYISPEFEESIFTFIWNLLDKNGKSIFRDFHLLLDNSNLYAVYQSILANIRTHVYIELLKTQKINPKDISQILKLWNRSFLTGKSYKTSHKKIKTLYIDLINFDKNMKFGRFLLNEEDDLKRELEYILVKFMS